MLCLLIRKTKLKTKSLFLVFVFLVILVHFVKDITQDILQIATVFDRLGNVEEDLSSLPILAQNVIIGLGYLSFLAEIFLLVAIPILLKNQHNFKLRNIILGSILFLLSYFILVTLLDPRYHI